MAEVVAVVAINVVEWAYKDWHTTALHKPEKPEIPVFNQASSDEPLPVYYGHVPFVDPIIVFRDAFEILLTGQIAGNPSAPIVTISDTVFTTIVAVIGEGEIQSVDAVYLDGIPITDPKLAGCVKVEVHTGADNQTLSGGSLLTFAGFNGKFSKSDRGAGVAFVALALKVNTLAFPGREPRIQFGIRGKKIKDTRDGVTRFSTNPALAIRDFWTNTRYGRRVAETKIDDTKINTEASYFEERVAIPSISVTFTAAPATDLLTLASGQTLQTGNQVTAASSGGLPAGLAAATVYFWISVAATVGKVATTLANAKAGIAIDITSAGAGTHTLSSGSTFDADSFYMQNGLPGLSGNLVTFAQDVPFDNGDGVQLLTTGALAQGLAAGTTYYWIRGFEMRLPPIAVAFTLNFSSPAGYPTSRMGRLASSYANALAGIPIVTGPTGNTGVLTVRHIDQPRYACNGRLDPYANPIDNLAALRSSCRSFFFESGGIYHLVADKVTAGSFDLTVDNIVGKYNIDLGDPAAHFNRVEAHFTSLFSGQDDIAPAQDPTGTELAADGGRLMVGSLQLDFTTNYYMAQRLAQMERRASRVGMRVALTGHIQAFEFFCSQVGRLTHPDPGFANKLFRISRIDLPYNQEYPIELREYSDAVYTPDSQAPMVMPERTNLPTPHTLVRTAPPNVSGLELFTP